MQEHDLKFITGDFESINIEPEQRYLLKYFNTELQQIFLKYYLNFGSIKNFSDHTGYSCGSKVLDKLERRYLEITRKCEQLKSEMTEQSLMELQDIEAGKFKFKF